MSVALEPKDLSDSSSDTVILKVLDDPANHGWFCKAARTLTLRHIASAYALHYGLDEADMLFELEEARRPLGHWLDSA